MSTTDTTTTDCAPQRWRHRRNTVEAIHYDGTETCRAAIIAWVRQHGGEIDDRRDGWLWVTTLRGDLPLKGGEYLVHGVLGEFFPLGADVHRQVYEPANGDDRGPVLDRDQAAAVVLAADEIVSAVSVTDDSRAGSAMIRRHVEKLRELVHTLGASHEALR